MVLSDLGSIASNGDGVMILFSSLLGVRQHLTIGAYFE